jgi:L-alanine-DL-glutamate epimerase-like enolase superfamily enzyme
MLEVITESGHVGWARSSNARPIVADFFNNYFGPELVGQDLFQINKVKRRLALGTGIGSGKGGLSSLSRGAWSTIDIALWDLKGQLFDKPVHHLLGGARDRVHVYITFGVPYGNEPEYSIDELVAEAKHHVSHGNTALKTVVGQKVRGQEVNPDAREDYRRLSAVRQAVGPDVRLAIDGAYGMSLPETVRLCKAIEELDIAFLEEPLYENDPLLLAHLRLQTSIPIAAAETPRYSARQLLTAQAVDILQPNVNNDGGYTAGIELAGIAKAFNTPIGHGNGSGPYNIALHAGVENGTEVEYHQHRWFDFNAIFEDVPQPENGYVTASLAPGTGLVPKEGLIEEFTVRQ